MQSVVVLGHQVGHLSLLFLGKKTVSLRSGVVQDQAQSLRASGDVEPLFVAGLGRRHELDHGMCCFHPRHVAAVYVGRSEGGGFGGVEMNFSQEVRLPKREGGEKRAALKSTAKGAAAEAFGSCFAESWARLCHVHAIKSVPWAAVSLGLRWGAQDVDCLFGQPAPLSRLATRATRKLFRWLFASGSGFLTPHTPCTGPFTRFLRPLPRSSAVCTRSSSRWRPS